MKEFKNSLLTVLLFLCVITLFAQPPGGRRGSGGGPEEMVAREKQALFEKVTDLSEDQKMLLDGIYDEFTTTLKESFEEMRENNVEREERREKMESLRKEKDGLIADVLNEEQYEAYEKISSNRRGRKGNGDRPGKGG